jgi:ribosomal protein S27AE
MNSEITRRRFLKTTGFALAGAVVVAAGAWAQEKEKEKNGKGKAPDKKGEKAEKPENKKSETPSQDEWDAAWNESGSEETRTCPQCGATMYRQGRTWTCDNCGYSYVE